MTKFSDSNPEHPDCETWLRDLTEEGATNCGVWFSREEMASLGDDLAEILADTDIAGVVYEAESDSTRTIFGIHRLRQSYELLVKDQRFISTAESILGEPVYLYQTKLNPKAPGAYGWDWHIDYQAWCRDDGMTHPRAVTFGVYIDDVPVEAGPLTVLAGSHKYFGSEGLVSAKPIGKGGGHASWHEDFGVNLKYPPPQDFMDKLLRECPKKSFTGESGSVIAFVGATVHGSPGNVSGARRAVVYLTYNAVSNRPDPTAMKRPSFIVEQ
ncbi:phytanoyl-CoA dioxygenase family protein [Nocardia sp. MW-W600-9]